MNERPIPWYKNHILLLIILIPLATVCGSMYTIYLAISSKEAPILDDYSKTGLSPQMRQEGRTDITATLTGGAITLQREPPATRQQSGAGPAPHPASRRSEPLPAARRRTTNPHRGDLVPEPRPGGQ